MYLRVIILLLLVFVVSCANDMQPLPKPSEATSPPIKIRKIKFQVEQYQDIHNVAKTGSSKGFLSANVYYPKERQDKLPVVVVIHGWQGSKEKMAWIGKLVASRGYASLVITSLNSQTLNTKPTDWITNYQNAVASLQAENQRVGSPLYKRIDMNRISLIGHSMGAGGSLYYAHQTSLKIQSIIALAPYKSAFDNYYPGKNITSPTRIVCGGKDILVNKQMAKSFYNELPATTVKDFQFFADVNHNDFEENGNYHDNIAATILHWLYNYSYPF